MARHHVAFTTPAAAINAAYVDLRTTASSRARLLEFGFFSTAATANTISLERSTTVGTASTTVIPQPGDVGDATSTTLVGTAWSSAPASTSVPLRQIVLAANVSAGVIWTWNDGDLTVPVSASLVVINRGAAAGAICRGYWVFAD